MNMCTFTSFEVTTLFGHSGYILALVTGFALVKAVHEK